MKRILVCFAVSQEAAPFKPQAGVSVLVTGMGAASVHRVLPQALDREKPDAVLTCGFAGALDPALPIGAVLGETTDALLTELLEQADVLLRRFHCTGFPARRIAREHKHPLQCSRASCICGRWSLQ